MFPAIDKRKTGQRICFWMKVNGLTIKDVQEYLALSCVQTVYRWLDGTNIPSIDNLYALSILFKIKLDTIIVGNEMELRGVNSILRRMNTYWILYNAKKLQPPN